ncbi:hypothetical protein [Xanthomonas sp. SHU 199]|uniref:hypothetical protein n=1 Tax=Xanthomonas sp. SHU 199 TaxID=1591174 RepID=UPI0012FE9ABE|nr:hypothetical protein [Xanthomonas sp. SHU 199]
MPTAALPRAQSAIVDATGSPTREWYSYFLALRNSEGLTPAQQKQLDDLAARVTALEDGGAGGGLIQGIGSIVTQGSPPGIVQISLEGDTDTPGNTWYYGTAPDGSRGWWALSDGLAVTTDLTKTVGSDGVATFGLADLQNSGTGTAIYKTTRDSKGRTSGQVAATTNDLPEGSSNLYYTDSRADARANAAVAAHVAQADPHPQYTTAAEAAAAAPVQSVNARTGAVSVPDFVSKATTPTSTDYGRALVNGDRWRNTNNGVLYTYQDGAWLYDNAASLSRYVPARLSTGAASPIPLNADGTIPARLSNGTLSNIPTQA